MSDSTVKKVSARTSPGGAQGQKYLASGTSVAMRLWEDVEPGDDKPTARRPYETVGYVLRGRAELHLEGQVVTLEEGDSWLVPENAEHTYRILETFSAVEATSPPARVDDRDDA